MRRTCRRVRARLPRLVDDTLPGWRRRLDRRHLALCEGCAAELERQEAVTAELRELGEAAADPGIEPPDELLDTILDRVRDPGVRERVARPARGAVSGARPELSAATVLLSAVLVYLLWRAVRALESHDGG